MRALALLTDAWTWRNEEMDFSLRDLRAFAVRQRLDVTFHVRATNAAWMVNRRGLVAPPAIGDSTQAEVEPTLETAEEFLVEGEKTPRQRLTRAQFIALMASHTTGAAATRKPEDD
jgi:hypothetical protein